MVGGAVLGITMAIMQGLVRRWQGRLGGSQGAMNRERWDVKGNRRGSNRRISHELGMDDGVLKVALLQDDIDEKVLENIEEKYYEHQYTKYAEYKLGPYLQNHKYDLDNLNKDFFQQ